MAEAISVSGPISGSDKTLRFETGKLAPQSQGAVVASIGKTTVLVTATLALVAALAEPSRLRPAHAPWPAREAALATGRVRLPGSLA